MSALVGAILLLAYATMWSGAATYRTSGISVSARMGKAIMAVGAAGVALVLLGGFHAVIG